MIWSVCVHNVAYGGGEHRWVPLPKEDITYRSIVCSIKFESRLCIHCIYALCTANNADENQKRIDRDEFDFHPTIVAWNNEAMLSTRITVYLLPSPFLVQTGTGHIVNCELTYSNTYSCSLSFIWAWNIIMVTISGSKDCKYFIMCIHYAGLLNAH